jgi:protein-S-isoprenylcysteine O-methyltransferase Ste14
MNHSVQNTARGTGWVVTQFTIMVVLLATGPIWRGQWAGWWTWSLGGGFLCVGAWAGIRGKRDLGKHRTPFPRPHDGGQLITNGIYALVRHPLYLSVIMIGFAWALLWRSAPALAFAVVQIPFFDAKARCEEKWLTTTFSGYPDYARAVKRFIPGIY